MILRRHRDRQSHRRGPLVPIPERPPPPFERTPLTAVNPDRLRIAMIGTRGVPARYGGFETAIEEVGRRLADRGHQVLVYCRNPEPDTPLPSTYLGMRLVELPS